MDVEKGSFTVRKTGFGKEITKFYGGSAELIATKKMNVIQNVSSG